MDRQFGAQAITKTKGILSATKSRQTTGREQALYQSESEHSGNKQEQQLQREEIQAALALLLGPETSYHLRIRATRRLARQELEVLPLILMILSSYPEITTPAWPWWPPQYEHCTHLLQQMSKKFSLSLEELLNYPGLNQPPGPVLWISILEAKGTDEGLLRQGLELPWLTVRYAAAMALAGHRSLGTETLNALRRHQRESEEDSIRLSVSYALLVNGEPIGLELLLKLIHSQSPEEVRKAALFVLATELPHGGLTEAECARVGKYLLSSLRDTNREIAFHAAHAISNIAPPALLSEVCHLLDEPDPQVQIIILSALEEMARRAEWRRKMRCSMLPVRLLPFLYSEIAELRRQACCTLATCGGEFALAALGTLILQHEHPAHIEALESVRLLHGVLQKKTRLVVVRWLVGILQFRHEEVQITALDSLVYLLWQAHVQHHKRAWNEMCREIIRDDCLFNLLRDKSAWVRQRSVELLSLLDEQSIEASHIQGQILRLLRDIDSGVRACTAFVCGQIGASWAIGELLLTLNDSDDYVAETALNTLAQMMTSQDSIIRYAISELAGFTNPCLYSSEHLNQAAWNLLKRKQKGKRRVGRHILHTSA